MKEKPKMYQNRIDKEFHNNKVIAISSNTNIDNIDIRKKITNIIKSNSFIYATKVNIIINNEILTKKIIGIYNNNLLTIDNEYIPIDKITDIYK